MQIGEELAKGGIAFQGEESLQQPWEGKNFSGELRGSWPDLQLLADGAWVRSLGVDLKARAVLWGKQKGRTPRPPPPPQKRQHLETENKYHCFNLQKKQVMQQPSRQDCKQPF